ncbi:hypothetical protein GCM10027347_21390 [Larkinella harenae]
MWSTETLWVEVAIVSAIYALGNILFGQFEEQTPKWRRVGKYLFTLVFITSLSLLVGRTVAFIVLGAFTLPVLYIHGYYLPRKIGVNGLTGEPKSKYYDFRGWSKDVFDKS